MQKGEFWEGIMTHIKLKVARNRLNVLLQFDQNSVKNCTNYACLGVENCSSNANGLLNLKLIPQPLQQCPLTIPFARVRISTADYVKEHSFQVICTLLDIMPEQ